MPKELKIAFCIPCYNEAGAIGQVIIDCKKNLPAASIYIFDNDSTDGTSAVALQHGAKVISVHTRGKGNVVRRMFADVEADVYIMTDGDSTYELRDVEKAVDKMLSGGLDMVVGVRVEKGDPSAIYRPGHRMGNKMLTFIAGYLFGMQFQDMLSGYRIFSRRYVKSFPATARGFEIETELTVHALELRMPCGEVKVGYYKRPIGSNSKLSTYRDGWRILYTINKLFVTERPLFFFMILSTALALLSLGLAVPIIGTYLETGQVPRFPTALLSTGIMLSAMLSMLAGIVLHCVTLSRQEQKRFAYLAIPSSLAARRNLVE